MTGLTNAQKRLLLPDDIGVQGHGIVQVRDDRTDRVVQEERFTNAVTNQALDFVRWRTRQQYATIQPFAFPFPGTRIDYEPARLFHALYLCDSDAAASASEQYLPGNVIGFATPDSYSGSSIYKGAPNSAESVHDTTKVRWVFDFPTQAAVGTTRSLAWGYRFTPSTNPAWNDSSLRGGYYQDTTTNDIDPTMYMADREMSATYTSGNAPYVDSDQRTLTGFTIDSSNGDAYFLNSSGTANDNSRSTTVWPLWRAPYANGVLGTKTQLTTPANKPFDMAISGTDLWASRHASPFSIDRMALTGGAALQTITKPWTAATQGSIASDGTHLYCAAIGSDAGGAAASTERTIYKVQQSDGATVASWTHPQVSWLTNNRSTLYHLAWDFTNNCLWVFDYYKGTNNGTDPQRFWMTGYDATGTLKYGRISLFNALTMQAGGLYNIWGASFYQGALTYSIQAQFYSGGTMTFNRRLRPPLGARTVLGTPIVKANNQTMKITYQFDFA